MSCDIGLFPYLDTLTPIQQIKMTDSNNDSSHPEPHIEKSASNDDTGQRETAQAWYNLVNVLSSDTPPSCSAMPSHGFKISRSFNKILFLILPSKLHTTLLGEEMKHLKVSGRYVNANSIEIATSLDCNNELCIAASMAVVRMRGVMDALRHRMEVLEVKNKQQVVEIDAGKDLVRDLIVRTDEELNKARG